MATTWVYKVVDGFSRPRKHRLLFAWGMDRSCHARDPRGATGLLGGPRPRPCQRPGLQPLLTHRHLVWKVQSEQTGLFKGKGSGQGSPRQAARGRFKTPGSPVPRSQPPAPKHPLWLGGGGKSVSPTDLKARAGQGRGCLGRGFARCGGQGLPSSAPG